MFPVGSRKTHWGDEDWVKASRGREKQAVARELESFELVWWYPYEEGITTFYDYDFDDPIESEELFFVATPLRVPLGELLHS